MALKEDIRIPQECFCCKCKKVTDDSDHKYLRTKNDRLRKETTCKCCKSKKSTFSSQKLKEKKCAGQVMYYYIGH